MARAQENHFPVKLRYIILFVLLLALLLATVGTLAWMRHIRSLQTATLVRVSDLTLVGPNPNTPNSAIVNLGDIDVSEGGSNSYVFGVQTNHVSSFTVQLAHTTNIPITYAIYPAAPAGSGESPDITENEASFVKKGNPLNGAYRNESAPDSGLASRNDSYYKSTYEIKNTENAYAHVQENAAPLYWQSELITLENDVALTYFILDVSWKSGVNSKETDMVYLTVGTGGTGEAGGTEQAGG